MDKISVSIIVPVYNVEKYVSECLMSLVNQTLKEIEIIVVDDGSSDQSGDICDKIALLYDNVTVIHQKNRGVSSARNGGIKYAKGEYIGFVDGDDWVEDFAYEMLYKKAVSSKADICYEKKRYEGDEVKCYCSLESIDSRGAVENLVVGNMDLSVDTALYRREIIYNVSFQETIGYYEDLDYQIQVLNHANKIILDDIPVYHVRNRVESATHKRVTLNNCTCLKIAKHMESYGLPKELEWAIDTVRYKMLSDLLVSCARRGMKTLEKKQILQCIKQEAKICKDRIGNTRATTSYGRMAVYIATVSPELAVFMLNIVFLVYSLRDRNRT